MRIRIAALMLVLAGAAWNQTYSIQTIAGGGLPEDIPAADAALGRVRHIAAGGDGSVYLALEEYHVVLRRDAAGVLRRVAGTGAHGFSGDNGPALSAQLASPAGIALDPAGNLFIADALNHRVRKVSAGIITTVAGNGTAGFSGDNGPAELARLNHPTAIAIDAAGNLYVADYGNCRVRKISNGIITTVAGNGSRGYDGDNGPAVSAQISNPEGVAVDSAGNLYIAEPANFRVRVVSSGVIRTAAGNGEQGYSGDGGPAGAARLTWPDGVAVDAAGTLYIADSNSHRIRSISSGVISTVAGAGSPGYGGDGGPATSALLNYPGGVAVDRDTNLYIADTINYRVRKISGGLIATVAGIGTAGDAGRSGPAGAAQLSSPAGVAAGRTGEVYFAEYSRHRIRKVEDGSIVTFAGNGTWGYGGDHGPATDALLNWPYGVAVDSKGDLYIADSSNHRVRKVSGGVITTVAGDGTFGYGGDGGPALQAQMGSPAGIAVDSEDNLYIADPDNHRIRKVSNGIITTVAGNGIRGYSGDGGAALAAQLRAPVDVAVDGEGNLYIADSGNHRIRRVSSTVITTYAGDGVAGFAGDGGPASAARLSTPSRVAVDAAGNLYVADYWNFRIRRVSTRGTITTIAGDGSMGSGGDGGPATAAAIGWTDGMAVDAVGKVYLSDALSQRIRLLTPTLTTVSAASYAPLAALAPGMVAAAYGENLSTVTAVAPPGAPLPVELAETAVRIRDSAGVERPARLWFVSPSQINYQVPEETALGQAAVTVVRNSQTAATGSVQIDRVAPGLFTMNSDGRGVPAAQVVFVADDGSQTRQDVFNTGCQAGTCVPVPLRLGTGSQAFLEIYGTGIRGVTSLAAVTAQIGGAAATVEYAGPVAGQVGLDQVNIRLPASLAGRGYVDVEIAVDGKAANVVQLSFE
ncbi:MAG: hypothetical protein ACE141_11195 [Bryobacteraceae bacterium]